MSQMYVQIFILLIGLFLILFIVVSSLILNKQPSIRSCLLSILAIGLIVITGFFLDLEKLYQCALKAPDQIRIAGYIKGNSPNGYLVFLYKDIEEIDRFVTLNGRLDSEQEPRDGYFELTATNEFKLTRCSMLMDFEQSRVGYNFLSLQGKTTYLWRHFTELEPGVYQPLNDDEPRKMYSLVVSRHHVDSYPGEVELYSTYLDKDRAVAINVPVKTYSMTGNSPVETMTGYFIHSGRLAETPRWTSFSMAREVRDAWVVDINPVLSESLNNAEPPIIDRDNCLGLLPPTDIVPVSLMYTKEVQFQENTRLDFDLGTAASKLAPSLGFTQGQLYTVVADVPIDVPAGTHRKYKLFWRDMWSTGLVIVDFGQENIQLPFRARVGMTWSIEKYDVDCPR
jgi:hypothetical protein